jgi:hypothetical protein
LLKIVGTDGSNICVVKSKCAGECFKPWI